MKKLFYIPLFCLICFVACENRPPISETKFVEVYATLIAAPDSVITDTLSFSNYRLDVFKKFNINENEYREMVRFYNQTPEKWSEFFDKVIKFIESTNDSLKTSI